MIFLLIFSNFNVVYPESNETVEDFFICGTFDTTIAEDSIKILINKKRVDGTLVYSGKTFTFTPLQHIKNGKKILTVIVGQDTIFQWKCWVKRKRTTPLLFGNFYTGSFSYLNSDTTDTTIPKFNSYVGLNFNAFSRFTFKGYFNTRKFNNRISVGYNDSLIKINSMYINPEFSPLLLKGIYMNGLDISIGKHKGVSFVVSQKKAANKKSYIFGVNTYLQRNSFNSTLGIVRILDDTTLILPSDNVIFGTGLNGTLIGYKINVSAALSFFTRDIYREALSDSFQFPGWLFNVNKSTIPVNPLGLTSGAFDFSISKGFRLIRFTRVGYSFFNNAVANLINDRLSFTYKDRFVFNKLSIFGGYNFWRNNLFNISTQTRRYYNFSGGVGLYGGEFGIQYYYTKAGTLKIPNFRYTVRLPVIKFIGGGLDIRKFSNLFDVNYNIFFQNLPFFLSSKIYWHKISSSLWYGGEISLQRKFVRGFMALGQGTSSKKITLGGNISIFGVLLNIDYTLKHLNLINATYDYFRFNFQYYRGFTY